MGDFELWREQMTSNALRKVLMLVASSLCAVLLNLTTARAYDLPLGINLGFTSFLDGGPPAGPGLYFTQYFQYLHSDSFKDKDGHTIPFPSPDLNAYISLSQFIYQSNQPVLLGGKWGVDLIIPIVGIDLSYATPGPFPSANDPGFGDILVGPYIQWDPIMGENGPIFMHRIELQTTFPTGRYDRNKNLNPGSNSFTFNPYWAATLFITPKWTASARFHYLWASENDEPFGGGGTSQAGQAIHFNYASEYEIIPKMLRFGVNGYYLKQITDTQADGHGVPGDKEQVFAIGPGALFSFSQDNHIFFNAYFEMAAENRPESTRLNLRWVHHF
jgi:anthranilate 1,2-dioxygenase (deaminating, decarboxylating) large subunit